MKSLACCNKTGSCLVNRVEQDDVSFNKMAILNDYRMDMGKRKMLKCVELPLSLLEFAMLPSLVRETLTKT